MPAAALVNVSNCLVANVCRILYGQLHVKSYDWADVQQPNGQNGASSAAHLVMDEVVEAGSKPAIIFPTAGGNIHQFTAVTDCAVLDILAPPYSPQGGQQTCTCAHLSKKCYTCS